jgi:hypothetical protein
LSELDNEDFCEFKLSSTSRPIKTATKKRKFDTDITAKNDKQKRDYNYSNNSPAAWKKDIMKAKKYIIAKNINLLIT